MVHVTLDTTNPDLLALTVTVGFAGDLIQRDATSDEWVALTTALLEEHTPAELANMLTGACAVIAKMSAT